MTASLPPFGILYEDNHLLVVDKPAGLPTMGVSAGRPSLVDYARDYLRHKYAKPGNVYLGVVSRLDAPVTGVLVIARTSKAASRLTAAFGQRQVTKRYLALVEGEPAEPSGELIHYLRHDERHRRVHTTHAEAEGARRALLAYRLLGQWNDWSLCEVELQTGRKHQIRVQLAKLGHPIVGDGKYGATLTFPQGIALHAWQLEFEHPVRREPIRFEAPLPAYWPAVVRRQIAQLASDER